MKFNPPTAGKPAIISASPLISQTPEPRYLCTADKIIGIFNQTFARSESTLLDWGGDEPVYYPAGCPENPGVYHRILFAHGFVNSALHEIAHWCIAGRARRLLTDYGYWYQPDGRNRQQQMLFEQAEVKPQALEWHLAKACGVKFHVSIDNLSASQQGIDSSATVTFKQAVWEQALSYLQLGLPSRATVFTETCSNYFGVSASSWSSADFCLHDL